MMASEALLKLISHVNPQEIEQVEKEIADSDQETMSKNDEKNNKSETENDIETDNNQSSEEYSEEGTETEKDVSSVAHLDGVLA